MTGARALEVSAMTADNIAVRKRFETLSTMLPPRQAAAGCGRSLSLGRPAVIDSHCQVRNWVVRRLQSGKLSFGCQTIESSYCSLQPDHESATEVGEAGHEQRYCKARHSLLGRASNERRGRPDWLGPLMSIGLPLSQ